MNCLGVNKCPKVAIIMDKDILSSQAVAAIREVCEKCEVKNTVHKEKK
jgi:hypothetical protein